MNIGSTCYHELRGILNDYNWDDGFALPLTKTQIYRLKKANIADVFLNDVI